MKPRPLISRLAETAALLLLWPLALVASIIYLSASITIDIAIKLLGVWE